MAGVADRAARGWRLAAGAVVALLAVTHALAAREMVGVYDTTRDLYWAWRIAGGVEFPLGGPVIYQGVLQLGPWWYYLLAVPVALGGVLAVPWTISLLAWAQYPLGWWLGERLGGPRLGLFVVLALVMPGWSALALMFPTHTSLTGTALLAVALLALAWARAPSAWRAAALGLGAAAALHAHPSTLAMLVALALVLFVHRPGWRSLAHAALAAVVVALAFVPVLLQDAGVVTGLARGFVDYAGRDLGSAFFRRVLPTTLGIAVGGGWHGPLLLSRWDLPTVQFVHALWLVAVAGGFAAALWPGAPRPQSRWIALAAGLFVLQAAFLAAIRPGVPIWMVNGALPALALLLALGWDRLAGGDARGLALALTAATLHAALGLALHGAILRVPDHVRVADGPSPWLDAAQRPRQWRTQPAVALSLRELAAASARWCDASSIHGPLAYFVEGSHAVTLEAACGRLPPLHYGGSGGERPVFGMSRAAWRAAALTPEHEGRAFGYTRRVQPLGPGPGDRPRALAALDVTPHAGLAAVDFDARWELPQDALLAVSNLHPWTLPLRLDAVTAGGRPAALVHADPVLRLYRCDGCTAPTVQWHLAGSGAPENTDVAAILPH